MSSKVSHERTRVPSIAGSAAGRAHRCQVDGEDAARRADTTATSATAAPSTGPSRPDSVHRPPASIAVTASGRLLQADAAHALTADQVGHPVRRAVLGRRQHREGQQARAGTARVRCAGPISSKQHGRLHPAHADPALRLVQGHAQPSLFGHGRHRPASKGCPDARCARTWSGIGPVVEQAPGRRLQGQLILRQLEIHGRHGTAVPYAKLAPWT